MSKIKGLLYIDSNIYLELYERISLKNLLTLLAQESENIFITKQIVDEVLRNKVKVVCRSLTDNLCSINLNGFGLPDQFFKTDSEADKNMSQKASHLKQSVKDLKKEINKHYSGIIDKVALSQDEVSIDLEKIFKNAIDVERTEIERAQLRKSLGNPPGKPNDPLGDEIVWEQLLSNIDDITHLWIITKDTDYFNEFNKKIYLNSFLKKEALHVNPKLNIFIFKELLNGIKDFSATMKKDTLKSLTTDEIKEIEKEEKSISIKSTLPTFNSNNLKNILNEMNSYELLQKHIEENAPSSQILKYFENNDPSAQILKYFENNDPSAQIQKYFENNDPSAQIQKYLEENDPSKWLRKKFNDNDDPDDEPEPVKD